MHRIFRSLLFGLFIGTLISQYTYSQYDTEVRDDRILIMQETGEVRGELPVMALVQDTTALYSSVHRSISNSFLDQFLELYRLCQCYLVAEGELQEIEPAYLALTDHQGGYAKQGFILRTPEGEISEPETPYVDITVQSATSDFKGLMSVTQLFPHEMAHVMYRLLSPEDSIANNSRSVDMHYFSIITDYSTAFNEGFAEHMENVARHFEKNDSIRAGIAEDLERIEKSSGHSINGFTRDFIYPFRMGYYKAGMVNWYQKYEDYKRSVYALSGKVRYINKSLRLRNPEDGLTYRNAGVGVEGEIRNRIQFHATEGAISAFFTAVTLRDHQPVIGSDILSQRICDGGLEDLDPLQLQFLKYFHVLHRYVVRNNSSTSQLSDFIGGYIESFPEDEADVLRIYRELTGREFTPDMPVSLWLMVKNYPHRLLVLDPFGAIKVPLYTFNLNAAGVEDLLTIRGLDRKEAEAIISHRNTAGYFESYQDLRKITGLSPESAERIISLAFDQAEFDLLLEGFQPELSITSLLIAPLLHVLSKALLSFILVFLFILYLLRRRRELTGVKAVRVSVRYLILWLGIVLLELGIIFMFPGSWILALVPLILVFSLSLLVYRKKKEKLTFTTRVLLLMFLLSLASLV